MNRMKITKCNIYGGMKMKEFKYVITDNEGIHARPAGELVKLAKSFEASVMIEKEGKKADCIRDTGLSKPTVYKWWQTVGKETDLVEKRQGAEWYENNKTDC